MHEVIEADDEQGPEEAPPDAAGAAAPAAAPPPLSLLPPLLPADVVKQTLTESRAWLRLLCALMAVLAVARFLEPSLSN